MYNAVIFQLAVVFLWKFSNLFRYLCANCIYRRFCKFNLRVCCSDGSRYFVIAFITMFSCPVTILPSAECSHRRLLLASLVSEEDFAVWLVVCGWPCKHLYDVTVYSLCKLAAYGPCHVWNEFSLYHSWWGMSKPEFHTNIRLTTTEATLSIQVID